MGHRREGRRGDGSDDRAGADRLKPRSRRRPDAEEALPKPWHKRTWVWLAASPLICCLLGGALNVYLRATIDSHPVYVGALQRAEKSAQVRAKLGVPLTVTTVEAATLKPFNDASIRMRVAGPKGTGTLFVAAQGPEPGSLEIFNLYVVPDATGTKVQLSGATTGD